MQLQKIPNAASRLTTMNLDEAPRYERDNRSASPRPIRDDNEGSRRRSASPNGNPDRFVSPLSIASPPQS